MRHFTAEQLAAGKACGTLLNAGSSDVMERSGVQKTGITFGNDQAGSGDTAAAVATSQGSAGVMERSGVQKTGITFGNDQAGGGDAGSVASSSQGSHGKMERSGVQKTGITFGNDQAGGGDAGSVASSSQGSHGKMERSGVQQTGITFGHDSSEEKKKPWTGDGAAVEDSNMANVRRQPFFCAGGDPTTTHHFWGRYSTRGTKLRLCGPGACREPRRLLRRFGTPPPPPPFFPARARSRRTAHTRAS